MAEVDSDEALTIAKNAVKELKHFRDHYIEQNALSQASNKTNDVAKKTGETIEILNKLQSVITNKSEFFALKGAALNVSPNFVPEARELLTKAVKLNPKYVDAWNDLGECFWKNKEVQAAHDCFSGACGYVKNKVSLRNLSMVLRQMGKTPQEKCKHVEESVTIAKEAVQLDVKDGTSWFVLGNAHLSLFFIKNQNPQTLKLCMSAYNQAEKDQVAQSNADLHYNRSVAYKFQEEYQLALIGFERATVLDPEWEDPAEKLCGMWRYLENVSEMLRTKGRTKPKKLTALVSSLTEDSLGPYKGGSYTSSKGQTVQLKPVPITGLSQGLNSEKVVLGKVVCNLSQEDPVPFTFCMVDREEQCISVTVYNLAAGYGLKIGESVAIPEPYIQNVDIQWKEKSLRFSSIRVDSPMVLVVNGKKLTPDKHSATAFSTTVMAE